ncbi:MAG: hypothetical protein U5L09_03685 [Bacteroidales bacterium]|nr:hypothetical protein [Bacteroidales bacterium]
MDGIVCINKEQINKARKVFSTYNNRRQELFFKDRVITIPNTNSIDWPWQEMDWTQNQLVYPPQDNYNDTFLEDIPGSVTP